jgi:hypothetical protein
LILGNCSGVSILTLKSNETHAEGTSRLANSTPRIPFGPGVARMRWMAVSDLFPQGARRGENCDGDTQLFHIPVLVLEIKNHAY